MFDDDTSSLQRCADEIRKYGLTLSYVGSHCVMGVQKSSSGHIIGIVRKKPKLPFYQAFLIEVEPTTENYLKLVEQGEIFNWMFRNHSRVLQFITADVTGHEAFEKEFIRELRERFK